MVLGVVRPDALRRERYIVVALIRVDDRSANTGVRVDASDNERPGAKRREEIVETCAVEGAVAFLDHDVIACGLLQLWQDLGAFGPGDRDGDTTAPHVEKRVAEIWPELLTNPDHRLAGATNRFGWWIRGRHEAGALRRQLRHTLEEVDQ